MKKLLIIPFALLFCISCNNTKIEAGNIDMETSDEYWHDKINVKLTNDAKRELEGCVKIHIEVNSDGRKVAGCDTIISVHYDIGQSKSYEFRWNYIDRTQRKFDNYTAFYKVEPTSCP